MRVDTADNTATQVTSSGQCESPNGIIHIPGTRDVVVACGDNGVIRINGDDGNITVIASTAQCRASKLAIEDTPTSSSSSSHAIWASCLAGKRVVRITGDDYGVVTFVSVSGLCEFPLSLATVPGALHGDVVLTCPQPTGAAVLRISGGGGGGGGGSESDRWDVVPLLSVKQCEGVYRIAVAPDASFFVVSCSISDTIVGITNNRTSDATNTAVVSVRTLAQCTRAYGVAVLPSTSYVVGVCVGDGVVIQISPPIVTKFTVTGRFEHVIIVPSNTGDRDLVATSYWNGVFRIRKSGTTIIVTNAQCPSPTSVAWVSRGVFAVTCRGGDVVEVRDDGEESSSSSTTTTVTTIASSARCPNSSAIAVVDAHTLVASCAGNNNIIAIHTDSSTIVTLANATHCKLPDSLAVSTRTRDVIGTCRSNHGNSVIRIAASTATVHTLSTTARCSNPQDVTVDAHTDTVYVACSTSAIRITPGGVITRLTEPEQCAFPSSVAVATGGSTLFVACMLTVLQITNRTVSKIATQILIPVVSMAVDAADLKIACATGDGIYLIDPQCQGVAGYADQNGKCVPCPLGAARPANSMPAECAPCLPGFITLPTVGSVECTPVAPGSYDPGLLPRIVSFPCAPGEFSNISAATRCHECAQGFVSGAMASKCAPCPPGHSSLAGAASCSQCAAGEYNHVEGGVCIDCSVGFVSATGGSSSCTRCVRPSFARSSALRQCDWCVTGKYAVFRRDHPLEVDECRDCPRGAQCPLRLNMTISSRYFAVTDDVTGEVRTFLCNGHRCGADGTCQANRLPPNVNPLCGHCVDGYSEWAGVCVSCTHARVFFMIGIVLFMWACVLVYHAVSQSTSGALGITMYFWQVALLIVGRAVWMRWAQFLDMDFMFGDTSSSSCLFPATPGVQLAVQLVAPLCTFVLLGLTAFIHSSVVKWRRRRRRRWRQQHQQQQERLRALRSESTVESNRSSFDVTEYLDDDTDDNHIVRAKRSLWSLDHWSFGTYVRTSVALYFFTFNVVIRHCLEFFNCMPLGGKRYMFTMPAIDCGGRAYRGTMPLVVLLIVVYIVIVPAVLIGALWPFYRQNTLSASRVRGYLGVVYEPFVDRWFWWGMWQMLRRAALVGVVVYIYDDDAARDGTLSLLNVIFQCMQFIARPYNTNTKDNAWESLSLVTLALVSVLQAMATYAELSAVLTLTVGTALASRVAVRRVRFVHRWAVKRRQYFSINNNNNNDNTDDDIGATDDDDDDDGHYIPLNAGGGDTDLAEVTGGEHT